MHSQISMYICKGKTVSMRQGTMPCHWIIRFFKDSLLHQDPQDRFWHGPPDIRIIIIIITALLLGLHRLCMRAAARRMQGRASTHTKDPKQGVAALPCCMRAWRRSVVKSMTSVISDVDFKCHHMAFTPSW